jgi:hypothetical protein
MENVSKVEENGKKIKIRSMGKITKGETEKYHQIVK